MHSSSSELHARLISITRASPWFMPALHAVRALELASWCIGAGAVRNMVWDALHGFAAPSALPDIDVAYFEASGLAPANEGALQARLAAGMPGVPWEVTNQAAVHLWFENYFGHEVAPLASLEQAVGSWPEYATCVGLALNDDAIQVIAPHGLDDLFSLTVRHNPARASVENYHQRLEQKRYRERWPMVRIIEPS
ncbi:nucleotidyltransferase family protein [Undibacterium sp. TJN25]|uniref:nucleotidyltransferase family protein n=1 Tax=Undibacterium sp. TJN25 TaxID=3413056 RepID=UPI003BF10896